MEPVRRSRKLCGRLWFRKPQKSFANHRLFYPFDAGEVFLLIYGKFECEISVNHDFPISKCKAVSTFALAPDPDFSHSDSP